MTASRPSSGRHDRTRGLAQLGPGAPVPLYRYRIDLR